MRQCRKTLALAALCGLALIQTGQAQTGLTTIQDTLFEADGSRFSGTLTIQWSTFDAVNIGTIVQQSRTVPVVNGNLLLQLAPNAGAQAPANVYKVHYQSDGNQQFTETWTVPVTTQALTVSAVRTGTLTVTTLGTGSGSTGSQTPISESSIIGLQADLNQRPTKGAAFGTSAVAVVDDNGILQTAAGQVGDCVMVDGTTGPCGPPTYSDAETPGGIVDGTNDTFTLANTPLGTSLALYRNGLYLTVGTDYTLTGSSVQFAAGDIPQPGDALLASYRIDTSAAGNIGNLTNPTVTTRGILAQVICSSAGTSTNSASFSSVGACDVPFNQLQAGDRIEVRFSFTHAGAVTGLASAFDVQIKWGATTILSRHGSVQDLAVAGVAEAAITGTGAQISVQSWGTLLPFLPAILNSPLQGGVRIDLRASISNAGSDLIHLTNYTVLRYPAN
ncbi:MAG TPA: hypothetical protein VG273_00730 [Bryobacteraceae bacterium]|nr:hypothetical protein [Bryobacteraceae bacterium]